MPTQEKNSDFKRVLCGFLNDEISFHANFFSLNDLINKRLICFFIFYLNSCVYMVFFKIFYFENNRTKISHLAKQNEKLFILCLNVTRDAAKDTSPFFNLHFSSFQSFYLK